MEFFKLYLHWKEQTAIQIFICRRRASNLKLQ